jgi:hypothetical protein
VLPVAALVGDAGPAGPEVPSSFTSQNAPPTTAAITAATAIVGRNQRFIGATFSVRERMSSKLP